MRLPLILLMTLWSLSSFAQITLTNDREGASFYQNKQFLKHAKYVSPERAASSFKEVLSSYRPQQLCAIDLVSKYREKLSDIKSSNFIYAFHSLRAQNQIDDVAYKILIQAWGVLKNPARLEANDFSYQEDLETDQEKLQAQLDVVVGFKEKQSGRCLEEAYKLTVSSIQLLDKKVSARQIAAAFREAYERKLIDLYTYGRLEQLRREGVDGWRLSLKDYVQKTQILRIQFPLRDVKEKSDFVTDKSTIEKKLSSRQRLYENYNYTQIAMMGNIVKKLKERLDSSKVEILVYNKENLLSETVPLEPMERFRFALRILRKDMHELSIHEEFKGRKPPYIDIMTAAYEINLVTAKEIDKVAKLEEVWNPKRTFWDKAQNWVRIASSVAAIVIPPPYGFIPTLALVAIEASKSKKDPNTDLEHSLF